MGFISALGKFFGSIIFTTFLVVAVLLVVMTDFTSYDNVKHVASGILEKQLYSNMDNQQLADLRSYLVSQCSQVSKVTLSLGGENISIDCNDVKNSDASQSPTVITTSVINSIYYKKFDCSFIDCVTKGNTQNLAVVLSNEGHQFYKTLQTYSWTAAAFGLGLLLLSTKTWHGRLKGVGFNLMFSGLPFLFLGYLQSKFMPPLPPEIESSVKPVISSITSSIKEKFIIVLIIGIILTATGYALGIYSSRKKKRN